jgi:tetratricopeptide (TPR) repeat protein
MHELKPLARPAIPRALERAERYRLLNEPVEAESICLDVLAAEPGHPQALITLLLALTEQFEDALGETVARAQELLSQLRDEYERTYYAGLICERRAKAQLRRGGPGSGYAAFASFQEAMAWYERAEALRPPGNDDALLRWNTCARILARRPDLRRVPEDRSEPPLE